MSMEANVAKIAATAKAAHEQHRKSVEAAKKVARQVQDETGYGRMPAAGPQYGAPAQPGGAS